MAVDENLFKPERKIEDADVFWKRTAGNVILIFAFGVLAVIAWWPDDKPPDTTEFWTTIVGAPFAVSALGGFLLLMRRQNQAMDIAHENGLAIQVKSKVIEAASRPLALLSASHYQGTSLSGKLRKVARETTLPHPRKYNEIYWFDDLEKDRDTVPGAPDVLRQDVLMYRILSDLARDMASSLAALPSSIPCVVHLFIDNMLSKNDNVAVWKLCLEIQTGLDLPIVWSKRQAFDLMSLDQWMDDAIGGAGKEARLFIGLQLYFAYANERLPPAGSTEAAAALLCVPDALASRHRLQREAHLHRPVKGSIADHAKSLSNGLRFAGLKGKHVVNNWHTGVSAAQHGLITVAEENQGVTTPAVDIDRTVGVVGVAAPLFALAYAHASLRREDGAQMITAGGENETIVTLLKRAPKNAKDTRAI